MTDYVEDIKDSMTKKKFRDFPILDRHGRFKGFISRRRFLDVSKKRVILVDHNEKSQAVDGIEEIKFQLVPFENTPENAREILAHTVQKFLSATQTVLQVRLITQR